MTLTLNILRCPDAVPPESRRLDGGEFSIGRGPANDWVLSDPDRHLSKRHCVLAYRQGAWQVADTSTNGTFLNRDAEPIGAGAPRTLRDGDRLRLGAYEIEVGLSEAAASDSGWGQGWSGMGRDQAGRDQGGLDQGGLDQGGRDQGGRDQGRQASRATGGRATGTGSPFDEDPFASDAAGSLAGGRAGDGRSMGAGFAAADNPFADHPFADHGNPSVRLPSDFDPMAPDAEETPFGAAAQSDHTPVLEDAFQPPRPIASPGAHPGSNMLPENWDLDEPLLPEPPRPPPRPPVAAPPPAVPPAAPAFAKPAPPPPAIIAVPLDAPGAVAAAQDAAPRQVPPAAVAPPRAVPAAGAAGLLAAFLAGAGLDAPGPADPEAAMRALGAAFRATVSGLREVLIARAAIKGEFRIEQTMIRTRGNNPLKFSANDDDALAALLGAGRRVDMSPAAAINDALRDMRLHELATMAAMQKAVRELLARLDPAALRQAAEDAGHGLPLQRKARAWGAFEKLHGEISHALADDFDSVFGRAFARAYEQALAEAAADKDAP